MGLIHQRIVEVAESFIGMQEIPGNMGFKDDKFAQLMEDTGWQKGQAWCAYFAELVWKISYNGIPDMVTLLDKLFAAGAVKTFNNFKSDGSFVIDKNPNPGSVVIWQTWKNNQPHWTGHAGIVTNVINNNEIITIEGNTNSQGGREGIEVAEKKLHNYNYRGNMVLKGFIQPIL
jgi:hypothetical protein